MHEFSDLVLVDCYGHYGNALAASVFFNSHIVNRLVAEHSTPIGAFMGLRSHVNLPCLGNLAQKLKEIEQTTNCGCFLADSCSGNDDSVLVEMYSQALCLSLTIGSNPEPRVHIYTSVTLRRVGC